MRYGDGIVRAIANAGAGLQLVLLAPVFEDDLVKAGRSVAQAERSPVLHAGNAQRQAFLGR